MEVPTDKKLPIPFLVINKNATPVEARRVDKVDSLVAFFLGRRPKNYIIVVKEQHVINMETALVEQPDLCDVVALGKFATKLLYKV